MPNKPSLITISSSIKTGSRGLVPNHVQITDLFVNLSPRKQSGWWETRTTSFSPTRTQSNQASSGEEELACFPTTGTLQQKTQNPKVDLYVFVRIYVCRGDTRTSSYPWANNALNCAPRSLVLSLANGLLSSHSSLSFPYLFFFFSFSFSFLLFDEFLRIFF